MVRISGSRLIAKGKSPDQFNLPPGIDKQNQRTEQREEEDPGEKMVVKEESFSIPGYTAIKKG